MSPKYLFVGNLVLDDIVYPDGRTQMAAPGGNSLYAAIGAKIWSDDVGIVSKVGRDWPEQYTKLLQKHHIAVDALSIRNAETLRNWVLYESNGQRTYVSRNSEVVALTPTPYSSILPSTEDINAFGWAAQQVQLQISPTPNDLPAGYWKADTIHFCPMRLETLLAWRIALKKNPRLTITLDILPYPVNGNLNDPDLLDLLANTTVFMPSQAEAQHLQPDGNLLYLCRQITQRGPKAVVIKNGEAGSIVYDGTKNIRQHIPIYPTAPGDLTGAGDSYCGGFAVGYARTGSPFEAALYGTVSASFIIEDFGALHALNITRTQAENRLKELKQLVTQIPIQAG